MDEHDSVTTPNFEGDFSEPINTGIQGSENQIKMDIQLGHIQKAMSFNESKSERSMESPKARQPRGRKGRGSNSVSSASSQRS